jgi:uncharacterized protein
MNSENVVIIMAKQPRAGKTKTRLCPPVSPEGAALLAEALLKDTIALVAELENADLAIAISPPESLEYFQGISPKDSLLLPVAGTNIGVCLERALAGLLQRGYKKALALNADGPSLPPENIIQAIDCLDTNDVVLGPSEDGGYYLIGLKEITSEVFADIQWSTSQVLVQTLQNVHRLGLGVALTPPWYDIDTVADAWRLQSELERLPPDRLSHSRRYFNRYPLTKPQL